MYKYYKNKRIILTTIKKRAFLIDEKGKNKIQIKINELK